MENGNEFSMISHLVPLSTHFMKCFLLHALRQEFFVLSFETEYRLESQFGCCSDQVLVVRRWEGAIHLEWNRVEMEKTTLKNLILF